LADGARSFVSQRQSMRRKALREVSISSRPSSLRKSNARDQHAGDEQRRVDGRQLALPHAVAVFIQEVIIKSVEAGPPSRASL